MAPDQAAQFLPPSADGTAVSKSRTSVDGKIIEDRTVDDSRRGQILTVIHEAHTRVFPQNESAMSTTPT